MLGPNIIGTIGSPEVANSTTAMYIDGDNLNGAFKVLASSGVSHWTTYGSYSGMNRACTFDASRSNSVYTDSGKVYPLSLALNFIIKT